MKLHFHDVLLPQGDIEVSSPLFGEKDDTEIIHLPRLVVDFNRWDFGRFRVCDQ